jgi:hypothetical protein
MLPRPADPWKVPFATFGKIRDKVNKKCTCRLHLFRGPRASHCAILEMPGEFFALTDEFIEAI